MLYGRDAELERLGSVVDAAVAGRSAAVVVAGDAGIGKSALVGETVRAATAARVLRTDGVQTEAHVSLSGLFDVLTPILDNRHELPDPQRAALERAFSIDGAFARPPAEDPLSLRVATHALLAVAAEASPLLVVVDDAQWVDRESLQTLLFAVRRLHADRIGFLFAVRATDADALPADLSDLPVLTLSGLDAYASRALLLAQAPELTDRAVIETIHATAQGNPLALIEIPGLLGPDPMASGVLSRPLPIGEVIQGSVTPRLAGLPERSGQAMVIAAAAHDLRRDNVSGALAQVGLDMSDLAAAE
ncbi:MAG: AAA family ATPase, partial [Jiangellaceae bacterium]